MVFYFLQRMVEEYLAYILICISKNFTTLYFKVCYLGCNSVIDSILTKFPGKPWSKCHSIDFFSFSFFFLINGHFSRTLFLLEHIANKINQTDHNYSQRLTDFPQATEIFSNIHGDIIYLIYMYIKSTGQSDIGQVILDHFLEVKNVHINALVQDNKFYGTFNAVFAVFH